MVFLETKVKLDNSNNVMRRVAPMSGWLHNYNSFPKGRIWVWWNTQKVSIKELAQGNQILHCEVDLLDRKSVV